MVFWLLTILFTLFIYFFDRTIIVLKENGNYKKYLYISSFILYIFIVLILGILSSTLDLI
ncbi:hypothetical protein B5F09_08050 [Erysipelatoclostridium sp. An173]|nr:hypothetical protein B5F09_08050 [Erysipelatoclostridium sp. An173]